MRFARAWAICLSVFLIAITALAAPASAQSKQTQTQQPRVYLLRGLANIFSLGMDDLTAKLNARGIKASVHSYADLVALSNYAIEQATQGKRPTPVIIIGHSLGADAAVYMGNRLTAAGVPVPLVVTFDPVNFTIASAKIGKVVNYYQAGGSGKPVSGPRVDNIDLTSSGALSHFNIDKAAELHNRVIAMIQRPAARPAVASKPKPKPVDATAASTATPDATPASAPAETPAATPASTPATPVVAPASSTSSSAAPASAGTETAAAPSAAVIPPAGVGTSNSN